MIASLLKWLTSGALDRALGSVDTYIESTTDKERIKAEVVQSFYVSRSSFMQAGGFVLMLLFAVPTAIKYGMINLYDVLWCKGCMFPQSWTIAAYQPPFDEWAGWVVIACLGGAGAFAFKR